MKFSLGLVPYQLKRWTNALNCCFTFPDPLTNYDLEFPRRTNDDYVLGPGLPMLSAFTVSFFVSFTHPGDKTYINYFAKGHLNEIFIHERKKHFTVRIRSKPR